MEKDKQVYYSDYLQLDKILNAQDPESLRSNVKAHDELLFIITHQAYELWFKQILYELQGIIGIFKKQRINDNAPDLYKVHHLMNRIKTIFGVLVHQIDIMETMTPLDFLDFRNYLRPASGFQSYQFKLVEAALGLTLKDRFQKDYYLSQLRPEHIELVKDMEESNSVLELTNKWLERMPFFESDEFWDGYQALTSSGKEMDHPFWNDYYHLYDQSLQKGETENLAYLKVMLQGKDRTGALSAKAERNALFIILYRDYPLLQLPYQYLSGLTEMDEMLATWRFRHLSMVQRIIGRRIGTGGSSGSSYLRSSLEKHYIFNEIAQLTTFLIERKNIPELTPTLQKRLGYYAS